MKTPTSTKNLLLASGRAWVSSAALLSFLFLLAAPIKAQGGNQETPAIVGTSADLEDLIVTVSWQDSIAADRLEITVFDENDLQIAEQLVWPSPGERVHTTFDNFLHNLPESGFQFSVKVRDAAGRDVSQRHAFRVMLECPPSMEYCEWRTQDGLFTDALAISKPLMAALDALEARKSSNLLMDILDEQPDLRGSVFSLAAQMDRLDQQLGLEDECTCAWEHTSTHDPDQRERKYSWAGQIGGCYSGREQVEVNGVGATAIAAGQACDFPNSHLATATGTSEQTMKLRCWKVRGWEEVAHLPLLPSPGAPAQGIRLPIVEACPDSCRGTVESSARIGYRFSTCVHEPVSGSGLDALALADASLARDDGVNYPPKKNTWQNWLQWSPGNAFMEKLGAPQIPSEGVFVDDNIRRLTTILSAKATVTFQAEGDGVWSYATAHITGVLLQSEGHADCAVLPTCTAELGVSNGGPESDDCGEAQIEPWGD